MKSSRQFTNVFVSSGPSGIQSNNWFAPQSRASSQLFDRVEKPSHSHKIQTCSSAIFQPIRLLKSLYHTNNKPLLRIQQSYVASPVVYSIQRSKSQIIKPIYYSSYKNEQNKSLNQTGQLGSSRASQVTFSKSSDFITNLEQSKNNVYSSNKITFETPKRFINDYFSYENHCSSNKTFLEKEINNSKVSLKNSYIIKTQNLENNSELNNKQIKEYNFLQKPRQLEKIKVFVNKLPNSKNSFNSGNTNFSTNLPLYKQIFSNNISKVSSFASINNRSLTKIRFNYISPSKSQGKVPRKLSFKKQDIQNPAFKLLKKKKDLKIKKHILEQNNQVQVINEYFPEFKIKRNKPKNIKSPNKNRCINSDYITKTQKQFEDERHTFIAGLQGLSHISQKKQKQEQTQASSQTPKQLHQMSPTSHNQMQACQNTTKNLNISQQVNQQRTPETYIPNTTKGFRVTLEGKTAQIGQNQEYSDKAQGVKASCQKAQYELITNDLSVDSLRNCEIGEFLRQEKDSSLTTDYQEEIVKKIKNDLGLNFSYCKN